MIETPSQGLLCINKKGSNMRSDYYFYCSKSNNLEHHGILGQKWGERNGPPYPLDEGREHKQRKITKKTNQNNILFSELESNSLFDAKGLLNKIGNLNYKDVTVFKQKKKKTRNNIQSISQDASIINPSKGKNNCVACSIAYDLRRRGLDIIANKNKKDTTFDFFGRFNLWYKDPSINVISSTSSSKKTYKYLSKELIKQGSGARGIVTAHFFDANRVTSHMISYQVLGRNLYFIDAQKGIVMQDPYKALFSQVVNNRPILYSRLDDIEINWKYMKEIVSNRL